MTRRTLAAASAALVLATGCTGAPRAARPTPAPTVTPSATPSPSASPTPSPSATPVPRGSMAPVPEGGTVIGVLGDYGIRGGAVADVVALMRRFAPGGELDAVVTTGDNAYQRGTAEQAAFARRSLQPLLAGETDLYPSLGNHDVETRDGAEVMRALGMRERWYRTVVGPVELVVLDSTRVSDRSQAGFLRQALSTRRAPFRVVVFHHPAVSCSAHPPDQKVVAQWLPQFADTVDLVLAGHNHTYERFRPARGERPALVTTGGGGAGLYRSSRLACRGPGRPALLRTVHHAVRLVATPDRLLLEAVGLTGTVFDRVELAAMP